MFHAIFCNGQSSIKGLPGGSTPNTNAEVTNWWPSGHIWPIKIWFYLPHSLKKNGISHQYLKNKDVTLKRVLLAASRNKNRSIR